MVVAVVDSSRRFAALKLRALVVIVMVLVAAVTAAALLFDPMAEAIRAIYAWIWDRSGQPFPHLPEPVQPGPVWHRMLQITSVIASLLALAGFSLGLFGRTPGRVVAIPPVVLIVLSLWWLPPDDEWLGVMPSRVERDIVHGRFDAAERWLAGSRLSDLGRRYLQAQIALRAADAQGLREAGRPLLEITDRWAYGQPVAIEEGRMLVQFRPEVIHAVDTALNGHPASGVGLQWATDGSAEDGVLSRGIRGAFGLLLAAASMLLLWLWDRMRRHITRIDALLAASTVRSLALDSRGGAPGVRAPDEIASSLPARDAADNDQPAASVGRSE